MYPLTARKIDAIARPARIRSHCAFEWSHHRREDHSLREPSDIQRLVDNLFEEASAISRLDAVVRAESLDMPVAVREIVALLPPGHYARQQLCDQLNSAITAHGYGAWMGTVE